MNFPCAEMRKNDPLQKRCFPPVLGQRPRTLILGSMPGEKSLREQQYYAHPQNAFWFIMQKLLNMPPDSCYQEKLAIMMERGIALWDVLQSCQREGSLDSSIKNKTIRINDFAALLKRHATIELIAFNGAKAEQEFNRRVAPTLSEKAQNISRVRLPSTSPAMASLNKQQKLAIWKDALKFT